MSDLAEVLNRAADLITPPGAWTQGAFARAEDGCRVPFSSAEATCFCMSGAVYRCLPKDTSIDAAHKLVKELTGAPYMSLWNDRPGRSQAEAVQLLRDAARLAEHEETTNAC